MEGWGDSRSQSWLLGMGSAGSQAGLQKGSEVPLFLPRT